MESEFKLMGSSGGNYSQWIRTTKFYYYLIYRLNIVKGPHYLSFLFFFSTCSVVVSLTWASLVAWMDLLIHLYNFFEFVYLQNILCISVLFQPLYIYCIKCIIKVTKILKFTLYSVLSLRNYYLK